MYRGGRGRGKFPLPKHYKKIGEFLSDIWEPNITKPYPEVIKRRLEKVGIKNISVMQLAIRDRLESLVTISHMRKRVKGCSDI